MATPRDTIALARRYENVHESPAGSNHQQFGVWYGFDHVPWCAIFVSFILYTCGIRIKGATTSKGWSACDAITVWGKRNGRFHADARVGDLALFDAGGPMGVANHVEVVTKVGKGGAFTSIGGNTGPANLSNGGMVLEHNHAGNDMIGFVTPPYDAEPVHAPPPRTTKNSPLTRLLLVTSPYIHGTDVAWVQSRLITKGYLRRGQNDGIYGPITAAAVRAFQRAAGIKVDGIAGPVTGAYLASGR